MKILVLSLLCLFGVANVCGASEKKWEQKNESASNSVVPPAENSQMAVYVPQSRFQIFLDNFDDMFYECAVWLKWLPRNAFILLKNSWFRS